LEALCFDFGYLSITNKFLIIHKGKDHIPAIIDELSLNLQNLKVSRYDYLKLYNYLVYSYLNYCIIIIFRVQLNDGIKFFLFDCLLLQPITFSLIVKRNLSSAWYTDHPDFDIVAKFDSIKVYFI
jgi:vacuolar protein sorting-associated protein 13A/C